MLVDLYQANHFQIIFIPINNMNHIWSVLCQNTQIDIDTNNLSITNVLEQLVISVDPKNIQTNQIINVPLTYEIVSLWSKEESEKSVHAEIILEIVDPKGNVLKSFSQKSEMPETMKRLRTRFKIQGLGLTMSGFYKFIIKVKEQNKKNLRQVAEVPLEVHISSSQKSPTKN